MYTLKNRSANVKIVALFCKGEFFIMFKSWISMWKNAFNYTGTATRKDYWLALIMNVIVMYIGAIPCGLIAKFAVPNTAVET